MKRIIYLLPIFIFSFSTAFASSIIDDIFVSPAKIIQGDPIMLTVNATSSPIIVLFDNKIVPLFTYESKPTALIAVDIYASTGTHEISVSFKNGSVIKKEINVLARNKIEESLGIPEKLGGNTQAAGQSLINNLTKENNILNNLKTGTKAFWTLPFGLPLSSLTVTDPYGYNRKTGEYTIAHKGTDFHAVTGTEVYAMNRGVVRVARTFIIYGKTIVVDHGLGLSTLYMHLSKIYVNNGELVQKGQLIGLSGSTGYADVPHLHLSVKIYGISIDPEIFINFFK